MLIEGLDRLGLRDPLRFLRAATWLATGGRLRAEIRASRGVRAPSELPGPWLLYLTQGTLSWIDYHEGGRSGAAYIRRALDAAGYTLTKESRLLDFGCGVGRILRWWDGQVIAEGCDYNSRLAAWCNNNLTGVAMSQNLALPPTTYTTAAFDVLYAQSVMTHLPPSEQVAWMSEWSRVVRPGGLILATFLGSSHLPADANSSELSEAGYLLRSPQRAGANLCTIWNTADDVVGRVGKGLQLVFSEERGMPSSDQDVYIFRVPDR